MEGWTGVKTTVIFKNVLTLQNTGNNTQQVRVTKDRKEMSYRAELKEGLLYLL